MADEPQQDPQQDEQPDASGSDVHAALITSNGDAPVRLTERFDITADEVFAANDHRVIDVPVDEWKPGAFVYVHTPSAGDKDYLEQVLMFEDVTNPDGTTVQKARKMGKDEIRAYFVAMVARNSKGERIFGAKDVKRLKAKAIAPMDRIWDAMVKASIISEKDVDRLAKNSDAVSGAIS